MNTEIEIAAAIREAAAAKTPLELKTGGTRRALGRPVQAAKTLSLAGLKDVTLLGSNGEPTIGGAVAVAASGPRRLRAGAVRDALLGIRYVNGQGEVLRSGGRVMKNVTGYDLPKLMCGAYGTLGAITEIGLKVIPKVEIVKTLAVVGLGDERAVAAMSSALKTPTDVSAAAHLPAAASKELGFSDSVTLLRVEGFETQAAYRITVLREALATFGDLVEIDTNPWPAIRDVMMFAGDDRAIWRLSVKPTDAPGLVAALRDQMDCEAFFDWGGGMIWLACVEGADASEPIVRAALGGVGGHATLMRASDTVRAAVPVFPSSWTLVSFCGGFSCKLISPKPNLPTPIRRAQMIFCGSAFIADFVRRLARPTRCWAMNSIPRAGAFISSNKCWRRVAPPISKPSSMSTDACLASPA